MGRGRTRAVLLLLGAVLVVSLAPATLADRMIVEDEHRQDLPSLLHIVVEPPAEATMEAQTVSVVVTVEGPAGERELATHPEIAEDAGKQLVTVSWTPEHVGEHTLRAEVELGEETRVLEEREVYVSSDPERSGSSLPDTAPGTVQWAIAFGFLFFAARAGFGRRTA